MCTERASTLRFVLALQLLLLTLLLLLLPRLLLLLPQLLLLLRAAGRHV